MPRDAHPSQKLFCQHPGSIDALASLLADAGFHPLPRVVSRPERREVTAGFHLDPDPRLADLARHLKGRFPQLGFWPLVVEGPISSPDQVDDVPDGGVVLRRLAACVFAPDILEQGWDSVDNYSPVLRRGQDDWDFWWD